MPPSHPSATVRALKAKLQILQRPALWGSAAILGLAGFFLSTYLQDPQRFMGGAADVSVQPSTAYRPNPLWGFGENNYGGGFGNLPWLNPHAPASNRRNANHSATGRTAALLGNPTDGNRDRRSQDHTGVFSLDNAEQTLMGAGISPALTQGGVLTNPRELGNSATSPRLSRVVTNPTLNPTVSPLQAALNRIAAVEDSTPSGGRSLNQFNQVNQSRTRQGDRIGNARDLTSSEPTGFSSTPAETASQLPPRQTFPGQAFPTRYQPNTSPPAGTIGYTMPAALRTTATFNQPSGSSASPNLTSSYSTAYPTALTDKVSPQPIPGAYRSSQRIAPLSPQPGSFRQPTFGPSAVGSPARSTVTVPAPFSVPRPVPGSNIGGGEINSFSNP